MAEKKKNPSKVMTPEFRAAFVNVFRPSAFEGQEPKFGVTMLFPKGTDLSAMKKACKVAIQNRWKGKKPANLKSPFRDGDEKAGLEGFEGHIFVRATSNRQPGVVDRQVKDIINESEFYSGCYARATLNAFAYDVAGNKGVSFGLMNIQKLRDGESFLGISKAEDDFESLDDDIEENTESSDDDFDL